MCSKGDSSERGDVAASASCLGRRAAGRRHGDREASASGQESRWAAGPESHRWGSRAGARGVRHLDHTAIAVRQAQCRGTRAGVIDRVASQAAQALAVGGMVIRFDLVFKRVTQHQLLRQQQQQGQRQVQQAVVQVFRARCEAHGRGSLTDAGRGAQRLALAALLPPADCRKRVGFCCTPSTSTSKCRCGPVERPVLPTSAMRWPRLTRSPCLTSMREAWA